MGQFAFVSDVGLRLAPGARIVKAGEYMAWVEAQRLLEGTRRHAAEILTAAQDRAAEMLEAGRGEGLRQGKETSSRYMVGIVAKSRDHLQENEERVIALVLAVLKKILGGMDEREVVVRTVRSAMAVVSRQNQVTVMVAPDKVEAVKSSLRHIMQPYPRVNAVEVVADPKLKGPDCVLETKMGRVESSLESQLETLMGTMSDLVPERRERLERDLKAIEQELSAGLKGV